MENMSNEKLEQQIDKSNIDTITLDHQLNNLENDDEIVINENLTNNLEQQSLDQVEDEKSSKEPQSSQTETNQLSENKSKSEPISKQQISSIENELKTSKDDQSTVVDIATSNEVISTSVLIQNMNDFEDKIRAQFDFDAEFTENFEKLKEILEENGSFDNKGISKLANDFYQEIVDEQSESRKYDQFREMVKEMRSYLADKPPLKLTTAEVEKRKNDIKFIQGEILKYNRKVKKLKLREIDLEDEEDDTFELIGKLEAKIIKLYQKLRSLENKYQYFGDEEIDFSDLTENDRLNNYFDKTILNKFYKEQSLPDYNEVLELIERFNDECEQTSFDPRSVFEKVCMKLKMYRQEQLQITLQSYLTNQEQLVESAELSKRLDTQNNFREKVDQIVSKYSGMKFSIEELLEDEDSDDESYVDDEFEILTLSDSDEEFLAVVQEANNSTQRSTNNLNTTNEDLKTSLTNSDDDIQIVSDQSTQRVPNEKQNVKSPDRPESALILRRKIDSSPKEMLVSETEDKIQEKTENNALKANEIIQGNCIKSSRNDDQVDDETKNDKIDMEKSSKLNDAKKGESPKRKLAGEKHENMKKFKKTDDDCIILD